MFRSFGAENANDLWISIAKSFQRGESSTRNGRGGAIEEIPHAALCIENPRERWIGARQPPYSPAFALAEVVWILLGRNDSSFLNFFNSRLPEFAGTESTYHGAYGYRLKKQWGLNQIEQAFLALQANPSTRQIVLQIWDPRVDLPEEDGEPRSKDIPCNICALLKVQDTVLEWTQIMRSNDVFRGLPHNIVQFTTLHELFASWLGLELGHYNHFSDSLHVYQDVLDDVFTFSEATFPRNSDRFSETYRESMQAAQCIGELIDAAICPDTESESVWEIFQGMNLSGPWQNIAAVILSEAFRKKRRNDLSITALSCCNNKLLARLVQGWIERTQAKVRRVN